MPKISSWVTVILSGLALIYALLDNFNKDVLIASLLVLAVSIGMIINK